MFSSYDQMNKFKTSRRDDMVSLCYMMLYLLNNDQVLGEKDVVEFINSFGIEKDDKDVLFGVIAKYKKNYDLYTLVSYLKLKKSIVENLSKFAKDV